jgi:catechol 2,3-dioxygenase-like lactoylglutathione lyase family enzyme
MLCRMVNHVAYRCRDARETVDFYTEVLGLEFAHAVGGDHVPSTGKYDPHIHVFLELGDGSSVAFFEVPNAPGGMYDEVMPDWIQRRRSCWRCGSAPTTGRSRLSASRSTADPRPRRPRPLHV